MLITPCIAPQAAINIALMIFSQFSHRTRSLIVKLGSKVFIQIPILSRLYSDNNFLYYTVCSLVETNFYLTTKSLHDSVCPLVKYAEHLEFSCSMDVLCSTCRLNPIDCKSSTRLQTTAFSSLMTPVTPSLGD